MTFPVPEAVAESVLTTAGTSHAVTLPAFTGGDPNNDIGQHIVIFCAHGAAVATFNALAGWTELVDESVANGVTVWVHAIDGTEGSTVTFTSSASTRSARIAYRVSNMAALGTQLPQLSAVATGSSTTPNATTCTPTGGAKDYLWFTFFARSGEEADDDTWVTGTPTGFTNLLQKACGTAGTNLGGMIAVAQQALNAASLDAAAFTCATGGWRAYTLAIHPSQAIALEASCDSVSDITAELSVDSPGPDVVTRTTPNDTPTTTHTVLLANGSNVTGKRVVIAFSAEASISWPSGWTELRNGSTTATVLSIAYRDIDGTEGFDGVDDSIVVGTSASSRSNAHAKTITDHDPGTAPEVPVMATGSSTTPDPPSVTPSWGSDLDLLIAAAAMRFAGNFTVAPTDYVGLESLNGGDDNAPLGSAHRVATVTTEDPGTFTVDQGSNWVAAVVAVRPAQVAGGVALAATLDAVSDVQASLGLALPLAATLDSVSDNQASLGLGLSLAATLDAVSSQTAVLGLAVPLAATLDAVSEQQAFLRLALSLAASMDLVSNQSADLSIALAGTNLEAVMNAVSDIQASLGLTLPLAATVDSVSSQTGFLGLALPLAANLDAVSDQTAFLRLALPLVATLDAVSAMTADLAVQGETLTAFMDAVSDIQASLGLQLPLEATVNTVSDQQASLRLALGLAANMDSVTDQQAILGLQITLAAQLDSVSDMLADLDVFLPGLLQVKFGVLRRRYGVRVVTRRYAAGVVTRRYGAGELRREP